MCDEYCAYGLLCETTPRHDIWQVRFSVHAFGGDCLWRDMIPGRAGVTVCEMSIRFRSMVIRTPGVFFAAIGASRAVRLIFNAKGPA